MTRPGEWVSQPHAMRVAEELALLRIATANATDLPLATSTEELAHALNALAEREDR